MLVLPDYTKTFKVHIDAFEFSIGGVLMQERQLIVFESHKLNDMERCYTIQEKEMMTRFHCFGDTLHSEN